ncbi:MAG: C_GCAxxG_C_C family protein [Clostridia bacterium]|nr:C_GCAxxG_C_C family protein [Clostridia bacterium]
MNCDKNECSAVVLRAGEFFLQGYNCSQAVFAAFAPLVGVEEKEALRLASPFGGGFGRMREVCGAFSGMMLVMGRVFGYDSADPEEKKKLYALVQLLSERFRERFGHLVCRELLKNKASVGGAPSPRTEAYYRERPCARFVEGAAEILEQYLKEEGVL